MIYAALAALLVNGVISLWLRGEAKHDLNIRSAYLHMLGDAISSVWVIVAGVVVAVTGASVADPAVSILIGCFILWSSWSVLVEATNVLMEAVPKNLDLVKVEHAIKGVPGVLNVHDLHVWTVASGIVACSCHILVAEQSVSSGQQILRAVVEGLHQQFAIGHTTVQVEVEGCDPNDVYCTLKHHDSTGHVGRDPPR
jgi:cobalt-zinc-cadmium efflux system protein